MKILFISSLIFYAIFAQAQHKYDWSKYDSLTIKSDSLPIGKYWNSGYDSVLYPITESKADIEIRYYSQLEKIGCIYTMRAFGDSILFNTAQPSLVKKSDRQYFKFVNYAYWQLLGMKINIVPDSLLNNLISNRLCDNGDSIRLSIKKNSVQNIGGFEIKIRNKFKTFAVIAITNSFDEKTNSYKLDFRQRLMEIFTSIFAKAERVRYEESY
ncbi:hypothetical protein [Ferruginibacter profundus]